MLDEVIIFKKQCIKYDKVSCVYSIVNLVNNKIYIGSTMYLKSRIYSHFSDLKKGNHYNNHLQGAYNKYGICNFVVNVLVECDPSELITKEQYYIDLFESYNADKGYNLIRYINSRPILSEETKNKIREVNLNKKKKTHCKNGHEFTVDNTKNEGRSRRCLTCRKERQLKYKDKILNEGYKYNPLLSEYCKNGHKIKTNKIGKRRCNICENLKAKEKRIKLGIIPRSSIVCKYGHNKIKSPSGKMICKICIKKYNKDYKRKPVKRKNRRGLK